MSEEIDYDPAGPSAPTAKKKRYDQKYNPAWEKEEKTCGWLTSSKRGTTFAFCKACDMHLSIGAGRLNLDRHITTKKHQENCKKLVRQRTILDVTASSRSSSLEKSTKEGEIRMAAFIAEHNIPIAVADHLPKLIQAVCRDSDIAKNLACGRTKTAGVLRNVTGKHSFLNLCDTLRTAKFSVIIDESTDVSTSKHLCVVTRVYDKGEVKDAFFGLLPVEDASAMGLYKVLVEAFQSSAIPYKQNMLGLAADGASVMMGRSNSVMTLLQKDVPDLFVMKCACHSFHLCASYACAKLPRVVEDLIRDVYSYISVSPKRAGLFENFQRLLQLKPHKLLHPSQTRWLSLHAAVARVLEQYDALTAYFSAAASTERLLAPGTIHERLADPVNKLFLEFLDFILPIFNNLNRLMQSEEPQLPSFREAAIASVKTIMDCYLQHSYVRSTPVDQVQYKNPAYYVPLHDIYLGATVAISLSSPQSRISRDQTHFFKMRCLEFLTESVGQIMSRIPFKNPVLTNVEILTPAKVRAGQTASIIPLATAFPRLLEEVGAQDLDNEWRSLRNTNLDDMPTDNTPLAKFWSTVFEMKQGSGAPAFPALEKFVSGMLCLPHSSAAAERIFAAVNIMKTKQRNRLSTGTLSSILHTKRMLGGSSCFNFKVDKDLIERSKNWRQSAEQQNIDDD